MRRLTETASLKKTSAPVSPECFRWLDSGEEYDIRDENGRIVAVPTLWSAQVKEMSGKLDVVGCGLELATVKGRDVIPSQSLALSTALRRGAFPEVTVDYAAAVAYLRVRLWQCPTVLRVDSFCSLMAGILWDCKEYRKPCQQPLSRRMAHTFHSYPASATIGGMMDRESISFRI